MINALEDLVSFRRSLHRLPEVSGKEYQTALAVMSFLENCSADRIIGQLGGAGVAAVFDGPVPGPTVLIRCELDALPIQEINEFSHRSAVEGVSHKCGHDGHSAILCGLAQRLGANKPAKGRVVLLFQPAEENGEGAKAVLADEKFQEIRPDYVFALHNLPGFPLHQVVVKTHTFTAAVNSIIVRLSGKTAHAGEPEKGINPAAAMAEIITAYEGLNNNHPEKEDFRIATPVHLSMGEKAYGISAGYGEVHYTLRSWTNEGMKRLEEEAEAIARASARKHHLAAEVSWTQQFFANQNAPEAVSFIEQAARKRGFSLHQSPTPFKWGEDFGLFTELFPGAMFGLGAGENCPALHNPDYDFPDELLGTGMNMFEGIIREILHD